MNLETFFHRLPSVFAMQPFPSDDGVLNFAITSFENAKFYTRVDFRGGKTYNIFSSDFPSDFFIQGDQKVNAQHYPLRRIKCLSSEEAHEPGSICIFPAAEGKVTIKGDIYYASTEVKSTRKPFYHTTVMIRAVDETERSFYRVFDVVSIDENVTFDFGNRKAPETLVGVFNKLNKWE